MTGLTLTSVLSSFIARHLTTVAETHLRCRFRSRPSIITNWGRPGRGFGRLTLWPLRFSIHALSHVTIKSFTKQRASSPQSPRRAASTLENTSQVSFSECASSLPFHLRRSLAISLESSSSRIRPSSRNNSPLSKPRTLGWLVAVSAVEPRFISVVTALGELVDFQCGSASVSTFPR